MNKWQLLEALSEVPDDEPIWFWVITKNNTNDKVLRTEGFELTDEEYGKFIAMLEIDDGIVQELCGAEDYLIEKIKENRKTKLEGKK
jgi:hypothetical protein